MLTVTRTRDGCAYLHLWREGDEYFRQKSDRFLGEWTNVRFVAVAKRPVENVHHVDLSRGSLDFPDATFEAANAYHVLEHMTPDEGARFVAEIFRVLRPGAIFRTSVPDLETICRDYLHHLDLATRDPTVSNLQAYRWTVMEIFEQMVREKSGGMMLDALRSGDYDPDYVAARYSDVFSPFLSSVESVRVSEERNSGHRAAASNGRGLLGNLKRRLRPVNGHDNSHPAVTKERVRWMYDRLSLTLLLERAGFAEIQRKDFKRSDIPNWDRYDLDCSNFAERAIDPSVYVEGRKPAGPASQPSGE